MNTLRILALIILIIYLLKTHPNYLTYFLSIFLPYLIITNYILSGSKFNTSKIKFFLSSWSYPYDPSIYGTVKIKSTKVKKICEDFSKKENIKIGLTTFTLKLGGIIMKKFPEVNGNLIFGRFIPRDFCDVCCLISSEKTGQSDLLNIHDADKLTLREISLKMQEKMKNMDLNKDAGFNKRNFMSKFLPSL
jgi:hypothetical protein